MDDNENTRAPAGGSEPTGYVQYSDELRPSSDLAREAKRAVFAMRAGFDIKHADAAVSAIDALDRLASAPASAPLPLTDERIRELAIEAGFGFFGQWQLWQGDTTTLLNLVRSAARECLPAAPVADERATVRKLIAEFGHGHVVPRNDGSRARCTGTAACKTCQMEAAALSGGSPEPVSGSEGEEEGGKR